MSKHVLCCFKIKTATLMIGLLDLLAHLMILVTLLTAVQRAGPAELVGYEPQFVLQPASAASDDASSSLVGPGDGKDLAMNSVYITSSAQNKPFGLLITVCSTFITMMLVYGVVNNRPSYLMPYFSIKVFHVVIACLSTLGFYSCLPNIKLWIMVHKYFPFHEELVSMDKTQLELLVFAVLLAAILVKLYIVVIVWYCYRYMVTIEAFRNLQLLSSTSSQPSALGSFGLSTYHASAASFAAGGVKPDDESLLMPPKYDEVIKSAPPPSQTLVSGQSCSTVNEETGTSAAEAAVGLPPAYKSVVMDA